MPSRGRAGRAARWSHAASSGEGERVERSVAGSSTHSRSSWRAVDQVDGEAPVFVLVGEVTPQRVVGPQPGGGLKASACTATVGTRRGRNAPGPRRDSHAVAQPGGVLVEGGLNQHSRSTQPASHWASAAHPSVFRERRASTSGAPELQRGRVVPRPSDNVGASSITVPAWCARHPQVGALGLGLIQVRSPSGPAETGRHQGRQPCISITRSSTSSFNPSMNQRPSSPMVRPWRIGMGRRRRNLQPSRQQRPSTDG